MLNLANLILYFAAGFMVAVGAAWLYIVLARREAARLRPAVGAILRIRAGSGSYRSQMVKLGGSVWMIGAPLQRDNYVPLRVGEEVVIEAAADGGALLFRTQILARQSNPHVLVVQAPKKVHRVERREHLRRPDLAGSAVRMDGAVARIIDLSEGGARVRTGSRMHRGDRVHVQMPWGETVAAWVLSAEADEARLRFEELLRFRAGQKETAPAV